PALARTAEWDIVPIRFESETPVRPRKSVQVMRLPEWRLAVKPSISLKLCEGAPFRDLQHLVDQFARAHFEPAMFGADALGQRADPLMIVAVFARRLDQLGAMDEILMATAAVDIIVFKEGGRRQHHVRHERRLGHELLMDTDEQIVPCE